MVKLMESHGIVGAWRAGREGREAATATVVDNEDCVVLVIDRYDTPTHMTPEQARFLASCLNNSAARVEEAAKPDDEAVEKRLREIRAAAAERQRKEKS